MSLLTHEFSTRLLVFFTFNIPLPFWTLEGTDIFSSSFQYSTLLWFWYFSPAILTWLVPGNNIVCREMGVASEDEKSPQGAARKHLPLYWSAKVAVTRDHREACCCCLLSHFQLFLTPWTAACQASLSFTFSHSLLIFMSIESVILSNHLFLCYPLLLLPSVFPRIRFFSSE